MTRTRCPGPMQLGSGSAGLITGAMIFTLLRAFANGGASLTGIEAVSDAVGAFRPPEGLNARRVLMAEGAILGTLVAGISWLAHATHATPRTGAATRPCWPRRPRWCSAHLRRAGPVLPGPGRDDADPVHRREHQLQRVPVPDQLRGRRLVPAPVAAQARAPAGVLQRHHPADHRVHRAADHQGRGRQQPGPAVRHRRVHRVLDGRASAWRSTTAGTGRPAGGAGWSSTSRPG